MRQLGKLAGNTLVVAVGEMAVVAPPGEEIVDYTRTLYPRRQIVMRSGGRVRMDPGLSVL